MWLSLPSVALAPRIVLLQHANEPSRPTGTGKLLSHESLAQHLRFEAWSWAGRADTAAIERQVAQLRQHGARLEVGEEEVALSLIHISEPTRPY